MKTSTKVKLLKENEEDFEFYPTTEEIINKIHEDLKDISSKIQDRSSKWNDEIKNLRSVKSKIKFDWEFTNREHTYFIDSILDIGAGDGRVLDSFNATNKYGIEKAKTQVQDLINKNIKLIGQDFFETVLIDRKFDIVFCNPPYSMYKEFLEKIVQEVNAGYFYFVIPDRWKDDHKFKRILESKGILEVLGNYSFLNADRSARATVDLIRILNVNNEDTFKTWVEQNISQFKSEDIDLTLDEEINQAIINKKSDMIYILLDNYTHELNKLIETYQKLGSIDFSLIEQLGINRSNVLDKIQSDIKNLKNKYWKLSFSLLDEISSKLTYKKKTQILEEMSWFSELDFNENNIRTIVLWVVTNHNKFSQEQLLSVYDRLTDLEVVKPYKSNTNWIKDSWRYNKDVPTKYKLDYRVITRFSISQYGWERFKDNLIQDICVVCNSLGFFVKEIPDSETWYYKDKHEILFKDGVLFEYKLFRNGNVHFKFNQEFLKVLNIEAGKLKGWIKNVNDVKDEFDLSQSEAEKYYNNGIQLLNTSKVLLLK